MATNEKVQNQFVIRNYLAICKVCSTFLSNRRPDLYDTMIDDFVNECLDHMEKVAPQYDPRFGKESTFVYKCVENKCKLILQKRQRLEKKHISYSEIYSNVETDNENIEDEQDETHRASYVVKELEKDLQPLYLIVYGTLKHRGIKIRPFVRYYVSLLINRKQINLKQIHREKYSHGNNSMAYRTLIHHAALIRKALADDEQLIDLLQERTLQRKGGIT